MRHAVHLIYGAYGGMGSALTRLLAGEGCQLMLAGRDQQKLDNLADQYGAQSVVADAADRHSVERAIQRTQEVYGRIDGVANLFGSMLLKPAHLTKDEEWDEMIAVNLTSSFAIARAAGQAFPAEGGSVVLLSSVAARIGLPSHEAIAAAKAGIIGLARSAAATYAPKRIRFNVVAPGLTRTGLTRSIVENKAALEASTRVHPLGRIGEPEEVAAAIAWFLDPNQSWVTGQVLGVDGGLGSVRSRIGS